MKSYPTIPFYNPEAHLGKSIVALFKYDGSNIRAEWNRKKGFYKFGSRTRLISADNKPLGEAIDYIKTYFESDMDAVLTDLNVESAICFFEFWGESSAFGTHKDEPHYCTLIDVSLYKKGFMTPAMFLDSFGMVEHAKVLYEGEVTEEFIESVRNGTLPGLGSEGVVCCGEKGKNGMPLKFKVKRQEWFDRLRSHCGDDEKKFNSLR